MRGGAERGRAEQGKEREEWSEGRWGGEGVV